MKKRTRSILEELNTLGRDESTAGDLERRFINSIRSGDPKKFKRGMTKIIESKNADK